MLSFDGLPISGKVLVAYSWIEPNYGSSTGLTTMMEHTKYFALKNVLSSETDEHGIARFSNLTVLGSMGSSAYIMVSVDGIPS